MPITLSKIANNTASLTLQLSEDVADTVNVEYYPGRVSERVFAAMQSFGSMNESNIIAGFDEFNKTLANLIKSWDVYEDDAQTVMFPIDATRFPELPFSFRMSLVDAIMRDIRPEQIAPQTNQTQKL